MSTTLSSMVVELVSMEPRSRTENSVTSSATTHMTISQPQQYESTSDVASQYLS